MLLPLFRKIIHLDSLRPQEDDEEALLKRITVVVPIFDEMSRQGERLRGMTFNSGPFARRWNSKSGTLAQPGRIASISRLHTFDLRAARLWEKVIGISLGRRDAR